MLVCKVVEVWQDFLSEYVDKKFTYICYRWLIKHEWIYYGSKNCVIYNSYKIVQFTTVKKSPFLCPAAHIFVSPGDAPATINSMPAKPLAVCIFNSFRVIRCLSKSKNRYFYHIFISPGDAPGAITLNVVWMEREFDAYKLSRAFAHLTITVCEIERDIGRKSSIFHTPFYSTPPLGGVPSSPPRLVWKN